MDKALVTVGVLAMWWLCITGFIYHDDPLVYGLAIAWSFTAWLQYMEGNA